MNITVLSGKGGTGKTTVSTNLALSLENVQLMDADVEEPDSYIFIEPDFEEGYIPVNRKIPEINQEKCTACRKCVDFCEYNALAMMLDEVMVFPEVCHSCGGCKIVCPENAITEKDRELGKLKYDKSANKGKIDFWQGEMNIGEESSTPVIEALKEHIDDNKTTIIDAPPGTTCPTIEATVDSDYAILVTESTPFGLNDLEMSVEVMEEIDIPFGVIINRSEEGEDGIIEEFCERKDINILMKIPFNREIAELYSDGIAFVKEMDEWKERFKELFSVIEGEIDEKNNSN
ncbi:MAG: ATP-binding protein [Bacillota bacterium]